MAAPFHIMRTKLNGKYIITCCALCPFVQRDTTRPWDTTNLFKCSHTRNKMESFKDGDFTRHGKFLPNCPLKNNNVQAPSTSLIRSQRKFRRDHYFQSTPILRAVDAIITSSFKEDRAVVKLEELKKQLSNNIRSNPDIDDLILWYYPNAIRLYKADGWTVVYTTKDSSSIPDEATFIKWESITK